MKMNQKKKYSLSKFIEANYLIVAIIVIIAIMFFVNKNFFTMNNLINVLRNMSITGIMACGMTMLMVSGDFDLSFGSTIGMTTVLVPLLAEQFQKANLSITAGALLGMVAALIIAIIAGAINGYFVAVWNLPAMLVTIAMQYLIYGVAGALTKGFPQYTLPSWFGVFGKGMIGDVVPFSVIIMLVCMAFFYVLLGHTKFGRTMYVVGGNKDAARLSGINVVKYKIIAFVVMQVTACAAGLIFGSQLSGGSQTYGKGMEFNVICAVIIGGISIYGGSGNIKNTFVGMLFLNLLINAMTIANLGEYYQYVVRGVIMLAAIVFSEYQRRAGVKKQIKEAENLTRETEKAGGKSK